MGKHAATVNSCTGITVVGSRIVLVDGSDSAVVYDLKDKNFTASLASPTSASLKGVQSDETDQVVIATTQDNRGYRWSIADDLKKGAPKMADADFKLADQKQNVFFQYFLEKRLWRKGHIVKY